ncbi:MAG: xanthine dehydrogenase family protein molybdopterin-binding subunit [Roseomonas sp.]|nr:xanthine dehydrogenase family protein molybdopterin-binding subunit [Roseomonas sp.]
MTLHPATLAPMPDTLPPRTGGWPLEGWIGAAPRRVEDARLLTGQGLFVADVPAPVGTLHVAFLRAPRGPARIAALDVAAAYEVPGLVVILTAADLVLRSAPAINHFRDVVAGSLPAFAPLAGPDVLAAGQAVAIILAKTPEAAQDGLDAIRLELVDSVGAPAGPAFTGHWQRMAEGQPAVQVSATIDYARLAPTALEPRAVLAVPEGESLTLFLSTQTPHRARRDLAAVLGMPIESLRVIAPDVGGAFGGKASLFPEEAVIALAARDLRRPLRWVATRSEELLAATHGRGGHMKGCLGFDAQGRALALEADITFPLGHRLPYSAAVPARNAARGLPGPYDVPGIEVRMAANTDAQPAMGIHRGAGRPEATMLLERLMDRAARRLGLSPVELRRRNLVRRFPHAMPGGEALDSGDYDALLDTLLEAAGGAWESLVSARNTRRAQGEAVGLGLALYVEPCGQGFESARITRDASGDFTLAVGATAQGQGRETAFAQLAAEALGVTPARIRVVQGDTATTPEGIGALASRSTGIGGGAVLAACAKLLEMATQGPATAEAIFTAARESWAAGAVLAQLALDAETGVARVEKLIWVDDAGRVLNPMLAKGQMWGGLMMGVAEALFECVVFDDHGQLLTGSLMDYALPRADDLPAAVVLEGLPRPSLATNTPLGTKGIGEAGCIGVPAAVVNAALDAACPDGDDPALIDLPLTPERLWRLVQERRR